MPRKFVQFTRIIFSTISPIERISRKTDFQRSHYPDKVARMQRILLPFFCIALSSATAVAQQRLDQGVLPDDPYQGIDGDDLFNFDLNLAPTMPEQFTVKADGRFNYDPKTEVVVYDASKVIEITTDQGAQLFSKKATINLKEKTVFLEGNVSIYQGASLTRAESATYFWESGQIKSSRLRTGFPPFYLEADSLEAHQHDGQQILVTQNSGITTDDRQQPDFWFRAQETKIIPDDRIVFRKMKVTAGDNTLLSLPYFSQSFDQVMGFHIVPGARSNWGVFANMRYGMPLFGDRDPETGIIEDPSYTAQWLLDLRSLRGVGLGVDIQDNDYAVNSEFGTLSLYYANDLDPTIRRTGISRDGVPTDRFRFDFQQRWNLDFFERNNPQAKWYFDTNLTYLSDRFILEDFFISEFRTDPQPDNTFALVRQTDTSVFTALMRMEVNDFYTTDTRLPEITFDQVRRTIFGTNILHEGQTSLGLLAEEVPEFRVNELKAELATLAPNDPRRQVIEARLSPFGYTRFHTYQEFSAQLKYQNWLSVVPRVGAGFTNYSSADGAANDDSRLLFTAAVDASVKWSKSYPNLRNSSWGFDGLVHTVQPYVSFAYVATDDLDPSFPAIDRLIPTTRPRPINVGRFNAIDDIQDWTIARLGIRNFLMTRRDDQSHKWFSWDLYVDSFLEDPEFNRDFSNLYSEVQWSPVPWARVGVQAQLPVFDDNSDFTEFNTAVTFMPNENTEITLGHRYLESHPILQDSNLIIASLFHRINDEWGFGIYHRWELDDGVLEEQRYTINRDYGSWAASFGAFQRDNRARKEYGLLVGFTLKAFPSLNLPLTVDAN